jgi:hypothetical protein
MTDKVFGALANLAGEVLCCLAFSTFVYLFATQVGQAGPNPRYEVTEYRKKEFSDRMEIRTGDLTLVDTGKDGTIDDKFRTVCSPTLGCFRISLPVDETDQDTYGKISR